MCIYIYLTCTSLQKRPSRSWGKRHGIGRQSSTQRGKGKREMRDTPSHATQVERVIYVSKWEKGYRPEFLKTKNRRRSGSPPTPTGGPPIPTHGAPAKKATKGQQEASSNPSLPLTMVCVLLLLPRAFRALGWLLELRPHDTILARTDGKRGWRALSSCHVHVMFGL